MSCVHVLCFLMKRSFVPNAPPENFMSLRACSLFLVTEIILTLHFIKSSTNFSIAHLSASQPLKVVRDTYMICGVSSFEPIHSVISGDRLTNTVLDCCNLMRYLHYEPYFFIAIAESCVEQRQSVRLGLERFQVRNSLVPSVFSRKSIGTAGGPVQ